MKQCTSCGITLAEDARFCPQCGMPVQAIEACAPQYKTCTKCGVRLEGNVLFCNACGTKQYVWGPVPYPRPGLLLMEFHTCQYIRLLVMKQPGTLAIYDDRLRFQPASGTPHTLPMQDLAGIYPATTGGSAGIKVTTKKGKTFIYSFSKPEEDAVPYLIGLLMNYKY